MVGVVPLTLILGRYTTIGPVALYGMVKLVDFVKSVFFYFWMKKRMVEEFDSCVVGKEIEAIINLGDRN